jgi:hypothetical protein
MLPNWPHARRQAVMATIIPWNRRLGVSYTYDNGDAEAGPIGPEDWPVICVLERDGKLSFQANACANALPNCGSSGRLLTKCRRPRRAAMKKKRRIYQPRVFDSRVIMPDEIERIHKDLHFRSDARIGRRPMARAGAQAAAEEIAGLARTVCFHKLVRGLKPQK